MLLRVPGLGAQGGRAHPRRRAATAACGWTMSAALCQSIAKVRPFIVAEGWSPGRTDRPAGAARDDRRRPRAAEPVLMQPALLDLPTHTRPPRRRDRFRRLARRRPAACRWRGVSRRKNVDAGRCRRAADPAHSPVAAGLLRRPSRRARRDGAEGAGSLCATAHRAPRLRRPRRDGHLPPRPRALRPALPLLWRLRGEPHLLHDRVRPRRPRASRRWRRRCAATSTR